MMKQILSSHFAELQIKDIYLETAMPMWKTLKDKTNRKDYSM